MENQETKFIIEEDLSSDFKWSIYKREIALLVSEGKLSFSSAARLMNEVRKSLNLPHQK